jgi:hypothetical protein
MREGSIARCWCRDADLIELVIAVRDLIGRYADSAITYLNANLRLIDLTACLVQSGVKVRGYYSVARLATSVPTLPHASAARLGGIVTGALEIALLYIAGIVRLHRPGDRGGSVAVPVAIALSTRRISAWAPIFQFCDFRVYARAKY